MPALVRRLGTGRPASTHGPALRSVGTSGRLFHVKPMGHGSCRTADVAGPVRRCTYPLPLVPAATGHCCDRWAGPGELAAIRGWRAATGVGLASKHRSRPTSAAARSTCYSAAGRLPTDWACFKVRGLSRAAGCSGEAGGRVTALAGRTLAHPGARAAHPGSAQAQLTFVDRGRRACPVAVAFAVHTFAQHRGTRRRNVQPGALAAATQISPRPAQRRRARQGLGTEPHPRRRRLHRNRAGEPPVPTGRWTWAVRPEYRMVGYIAFLACTPSTGAGGGRCALRRRPSGRARPRTRTRALLQAAHCRVPATGRRPRRSAPLNDAYWCALQRRGATMAPRATITKTVGAWRQPRQQQPRQRHGTPFSSLRVAGGQPVAEATGVTRGEQRQASGVPGAPGADSPEPGRFHVKRGGSLTRCHARSPWRRGAPRAGSGHESRRGAATRRHHP